MSMTPDERNLLLLLARMVVACSPRLTGENRSVDELNLRKAITRIEAAEDRAADEERINGRG